MKSRPCKIEYVIIKKFFLDCSEVLLFSFLQGDYASAEDMQKKSAPENNPGQLLYAELGAGGGRKGPKPEPVESNYAQVKVDEMGYPARGPASDMSQPVPYPTSINRDRSRRHSPPPNYGEIDDDDGVIV